MELLAVVLHHPARKQNSLSRRESLQTESERLLAEIRTRLSTDRRQRVWAHGASLELGAVVDRLIREASGEIADCARSQDAPAQ